MTLNVLALAGGVGGAKLADGLYQALPPNSLTVVVNTADDFEHLGLHISPDLDTVCYTLAGLSNTETGWGRADESWNALDNLTALGGPAWFRIGDRDLGTHLERTRRLKEGQPLSQITGEFCQAWGIHAQIMPMSDQPVATIVESDEGELAFQEYFVARACEPKVKGFYFAGMESARPAPDLINAIQNADLIIICPSNPWVSVAPILNLPGIGKAVAKKPVIAVSPIIGGEAVKGPAAKMYRELGIEPSALAVAQQYGSLLSAFVLDKIDQPLEEHIKARGIMTLETNTLMKSRSDRKRLAEEVLTLGQSLLSS
jgi:LPPG:FO 2-phospho-L-lactate transferase